MASIRWIGPDNGRWLDAANWQGGTVPGVLDTAVFDRNATFRVEGLIDVQGIQVTGSATVVQSGAATLQLGTASSGGSPSATFAVESGSLYVIGDGATGTSLSIGQNVSSATGNVQIRDSSTYQYDNPIGTTTQTLDLQGGANTTVQITERATGFGAEIKGFTSGELLTWGAANVTGDFNEASDTITLISSSLNRSQQFKLVEDFRLSEITISGNTVTTSRAVAPVDTQAPTFSSAAINGSTLVLNYNEALDGTNIPAAGAFVVSVGGSTATVNNVAVTGSTVTLSLAAPAANGQNVTVTYNDPSISNDVNAIQDVAGNDALSLVAQSVTNNTPLPPPTYSIASNPASALEGNTGGGNAITYTISRTGDLSQSGSVQVAFTGSATLGTDYTSSVANNGIVSFAANAPTATVTVTTTPDTAFEVDETVVATISNVSGGGTIGTAVATSTITNDDQAPAYSIAVNPTMVAEGNSGSGAVLTYTVTRSGDISQAGSVAVTFTGSATNAVDYAATGLNAGRVSFLAGSDTATFTVTTATDTVLEPDETVIATISAPENSGGATLGTIVTAAATGTITNDDTAPQYQIAVAPAAVIEGNTAPGNNLVYTVTRTGDISMAGSVSVTLTGTADSASDFTVAGLAAGRLAFTAGSSTATFTVTTVPDGNVEPNETVIATLTAPQLANGTAFGVVGVTSSATGTINNDDVAPPPPLTQGTAGDDTVAAGTSTAPVFGGAGADQVSATPVAGTTAQLYGGSGFLDPNDAGDTISVSGGGSALVYGNGGDDQIVVTSTGSASVFGGVGSDQVTIRNDAVNQVAGGPGGDTIQITGNGNNQVLGGSEINDPNDGADRISISGNGNNLVYANGGDDQIVFTGTGSNTVFAGVGNDTIVGGSGSDRIVAGPGSNLLTGGAGADRFVHTAGGQDIITDFNFASGDRIELGGQPYAFTQTSDGNAAILIGQSGVIVLQGVTPSTLTADYFA